MKAVSSAIIVLAGAVLGTNRESAPFGAILGLIGFVAWVNAMFSKRLDSNSDA